MKFLKKTIQIIPKKRFSISPLDDRYARSLKEVKNSFSEKNLMEKRVEVEIKWLIKLIQKQIIPEKVLTVSKSETIINLQKIIKLSDSDFAEIKKIEDTTKHDIKAVEYFIKKKLTNMNFHTDLIEYVHFLCTSEDINNLSYSLLLQNFKDNNLNLVMNNLLNDLLLLVNECKSIPMMGRTHGQPATPTTLGKEIANFVYRLAKIKKNIDNINFSGKMNGAVGNYNAHYVIDPNYDWFSLSKSFIENDLSLEFNPYTTQIEPHDSFNTFFYGLHHFNTVSTGMTQDLWHYISRGYFSQKLKEGEIGSSIMPHKVNPINFENAEGNLGISNGLLEFFSRKLPISRFQRDLSDSSVLRNIGVSLGHSVLAYKNISIGLNKLVPKEDVLREELEDHYELLAEPIQSILRNNGYQGGYELLKEFSRGKKIGKTDLKHFIEGLEVNEVVKDKMMKLSTQNYIGLAERLASELESEIRKLK